MKHLYVNGELEMVENESDFGELIREKMGNDSESYFKEILEKHDNEHGYGDEEYYAMLAESRESDMIEIGRIIDGLIKYYFEEDHRLNRKDILNDWKAIRYIIANRE